MISITAYKPDVGYCTDQATIIEKLSANMKSLKPIVLFGTMVFGISVWAQLKQIDPKKLPQDERVQTAYSKALSVEPYARKWSPDWPYEVKKEHVVSVLTTSLRELTSATVAQNEELLLLRGLVSHLAYNVGVEEAYEPAVRSLDGARSLAPLDYRAGWFLGIHRCQSNDIKDGMQQFLSIEDQNPWKQLPIDFWDDYVTCASVALMPAHTLRAIDHAARLGAPSSSYGALLDIARKRYRTPDADTTYAAREAWEADAGKTNVQFRSQLCGIGFTAHADWHLDINDVSKGVCISKIETGPYPSRSGNSTPTLLLLTRRARPQETLEAFVDSFLEDRSALAHPTNVPYCPSDKCLAFEIVDGSVYQSEGGGHFLVVGFAGQPPEFPGLLFERPEPPPPNNSGDKITYYHANEKLHRFSGTLYSFVLLDSNTSIFGKAREDFQFLLRSIQLD